MSRPQLLASARQITDILEPLLLNATFYTNPPSRMAANLTLTILELHIGVQTLLASYASSHAPVLIRTMLESFVSLKRLHQDLLYINQLHYDDAVQITKIYNRFIDAFDENDPERAEMIVQRDEQARIIQTHTEQGIGNETIFCKFQRAGLETEYAGYGFLCMFAHNSATNLYARHGVGQQLDFAAELPLETFKSFLRQSMGILGQSIELIPAFSNASQDAITAAIMSTADKVAEFN